MKTTGRKTGWRFHLLPYVLGLSAIGGTVLLIHSQKIQNGQNLQTGFINPPDEYRPTVLWFWINGMFNKEGITRDLEAMKEVGLGGGKIFNGGGVEGAVRFASKEWYDLTAFAAREADRLGLKIGMNITEGFNAAGGPWISPEQSMQTVVWSETEIKGPQKISMTIERPDVRPKDTLIFKLTDIDYYKDIKVYAIPKAGSGRIMNLALKNGMTPHRADTRLSSVRTPEEDVTPEDLINPSEIIDLTDRMDSEGHLIWDAPKGEWTIVRMGAASTGSCTRPGSGKTRGLEADKLNRETIEYHFDCLCRPLLEMEGVTPEHFSCFGVDSWEAEGQNWSPVLADEFQKRRGYSIYDYFPVLTGRIVESIEVSERFLWDLRRTIADCIRDNFYLYLRELSEENGMQFSSEPYSRVAFDGMETAEAVNMPQATFWQGNGGTHRADMEGKWASSAVNVTGGKKVGSEAFPAGRENSGWINHPWTFKMLGDYALASGVNEIAFHCMPLQPWDDKEIHQPGITFRHWGSQYSRHNTWWSQSGEWHRYLARCQFLLQQGRSNTEALFMTPEALPGLELKMDRNALPPGYDWDMLSTRMVRDRLYVKDHMIHTPSGMKYHLLVLPEMDAISVPLLQKVETLVKDGANLLVSSRPETSRGLENYPESIQEVKTLAGRLWQDLDGRKVKERTYGKGRIFRGMTAAEVLKDLGVEKDVIIDAEKKARDRYPINCLHRSTTDAEIYFVCNSIEEPASGLLSFRINGKQPELWHPDSGEIERCLVYEEKDGRTIIPMTFDPCGSVFVVFRKRAEERPFTEVCIDGTQLLSSTACLNPYPMLKDGILSGGRLSMKTKDGRLIEEEMKPIKTTSLDKNWKVSFEGAAAPSPTVFKDLTPWNEHVNDSIRYFSGRGIYEKTVAVTRQEGEEIWLDLGDVEVIATVKVNGKEIGTLWKPPYLINLTEALRDGENRLEIKVSNLWVNRLIGDERYPSDYKPSLGGTGEMTELPDWFVEGTPRPQRGRATFTTYRHYKGTEALTPSGLIGPARLMTRARNRNRQLEQMARNLFVFSRNPEYKPIITHNPE